MDGDGSGYSRAMEMLNFGAVVLSTQAYTENDEALSMSRVGLILLGLILSLPLRAEVVVTDETGHEVVLMQPAQRIVSLAPHITEQLFAVGAGPQVVGVVAFSNYPEAAKQIPSVGGYGNVDLEALLQLKPDLVVGWEGGNDGRLLEKLEELGLKLYRSAPVHLPDIATGLRNLGKLSGHTDKGLAQATIFTSRLEQLHKMNQGKPPLRVFYQIWNRPLMTVSGDHLISDVIRLCGGENVFDDMTTLTPTISEEAVITANPELIIAIGMAEERPEWLDEWRKWKTIKAVRNGELRSIPPDLLQRATPRLLEGATQMCALIKEAKRK
jgi:iron complex transport system substrate-binding protein